MAVKPCPRCGADPDWECTWDDDDPEEEEYYFFYCSSLNECDFHPETRGWLLEEAEKNWNRAVESAVKVK